MKLSFTESPSFSRVREALFGDDEGFRAFQNALLVNPHAGAVIPGCHGLRKVRWSDPSRNKGKRGGIRIIYLYVEEAERTLLLFAYDKNIPDLTAEQKRLLIAIAQAFKGETVEEQAK